MSRAFSGTAQYLTLASGPGGSGSNLSLHGRFYVDSASVSANLFSLGISNSANNRRYLRWLSTGTFEAVSINNAGTLTSSTISSSGLLDQWISLGGRWSGNADRTVYANGTAGTNDTTSNSPNTQTHLRVGGNHLTTPTGLLTGLIAELAIWSVALDAAEFAALARGLTALAVRPASLVAYWQLFGRTSPEINLKDGGANLTVTGATTIEHPRIYMPRSRGAIVRPVVVAAPKRYLLVRN